MILLSPQNSAFEYHLLKYKIDYHIFRYIASTFKVTNVLCTIKNCVCYKRNHWTKSSMRSPDKSYFKQDPMRLSCKLLKVHFPSDLTQHRQTYSLQTWRIINLWNGKNLSIGLNPICHSANSLQPITQKCQRKLEKQFILVMLLDTLCTEQTREF